jgi:hypothetical protein
MVKRLKLLGTTVLYCFTSYSISLAQTSLTVYEASDPSYIRSYVKLSAESYNFFDNAQFYSIIGGYYYAIGNRHLVGLSVPFMHNIFNGNYGGYENTTGFGDIKMTYMFTAYQAKRPLGLQRVSPMLEVSAPTGEYQLGRGAGTWVYKPGIIFSYRPAPEVSFYPEIKYQFSTEEANSQGGTDGLPDPEDPTKDLKYQNLIVNVPMVIILNDWDGWFSLNAQYARSFTEDADFIFMRLDIGKMIGDQTSASLTISKFIAGQPRLNLIVQARFNFYLAR